MEGIINFFNSIFQPIIDLGAAPMMFIILSLLAIVLRVKLGKALEGGLKFAIALTGMGAVINLLTVTFSEPLQQFVKSTGIELTITDVGWAPLATITWGSPYTLFFCGIIVLVNIIMILLKRTNTLDVDIFNVWHLAIVGLLVLWFSDSLLLATGLILLIGILKIINADLMKPTFNDLLNAPKSNAMTSTHMNYMLNPIIMVFDKIFDKFFPWLDKFDFDAAKLNSKIGFWGSKFAIGIYLGIFIGLLSQISIKETFVIAFTAGVCLELFSLIGSWFIAGIEPVSQGITNTVSKYLKGRTFNIGVDWPFIAGRAEIWAAANILAPILLLEALILPGNGILPLGGIIAMGLTPALLVVTRGKIIRMILIGSLILPLFLISGTMIAPFVTETAQLVGAYPAGVEAGTLITHSTLEGPIEKILAVLVGKAATGQIEFILWALIAVVVYVVLFIWYAKQMKKRNAAYEEVEQQQVS
ncbi:PTS glucitol transporter subunit IIA [Caldibacillus thermoamylovorans]|uniref:PTS galactitol transporter subunit IIC n=1 Tax=Caldibacillus thermoamylovorans TaxID=35841 RepID=UPI001D06389A|nr:PTS transporter subunit IIC [Caldibacillus thermoamylovorans]MCB5936678.1 PTS glucitol transporter subunit IIA [Bacillus sp. DFI.2.34]MCB7078204.1 PTS glucitol transporter subunit IIA [Caldibacillus thermoamylovorans]